MAEGDSGLTPPPVGGGEIAPFAEGGVGDLMCKGAQAYLDEYVFSTDGPDHEPTEWERALLEDFFAGLISDERFFGPVRRLLSAPAPSGGKGFMATRDHAPATGSALEEIAAERRRQVEVEGWTPEHDDDHHRRGELADAAACYAYGGTLRTAIPHPNSMRLRKPLWPWSEEAWKPKSRRDDLVRAGALIVAEIERLERASSLNCPVCSGDCAGANPPVLDCPMKGDALSSAEQVEGGSSRVDLKPPLTNGVREETKAGEVEVGGALLPCPFCGGRAVRQEIDESVDATPEDENFGGSFIECDDCGASSPVHFDRKENLVDSWNRRQALASPPLGAAVEALRGFDDDFMTSEKHHPGYVLIPTEKFERIRAALPTQTQVVGESGREPNTSPSSCSKSSDPLTRSDVEVGKVGERSPEIGELAAALEWSLEADNESHLSASITRIDRAARAVVARDEARRSRESGTYLELKQREREIDRLAAELSEARLARSSPPLGAAVELVKAARAFIEAEDALLAELREQGELPDFTEAPWPLVDAMRKAVANYDAALANLEPR